jgi:hypothetical protein
MKYRGLNFPGVREVAAELRLENDYIRAEFSPADRRSDDFCGDVRLQVWPNGTWALHYGDSQYDQDHRGYWGCGSLDGFPFDSMSLARDLIEQCKEHYAQVKDD